MQTLNSPLELGVRALVVLRTSFPRALDVDRLVLLDYCLLHSADLGGPASLLPPIATRSGEMGVKRTVMEHGVQVMVRAGLIDVVVGLDGLTYRAGEPAAPFLQLVRSAFLSRLTEVAEWAVGELGDQPTEVIRERIGTITGQWTEQWADEMAGIAVEIDEEGEL